MMSAWGVQQGDPIGPLLFCLVIHPVLTEVAKQMVAEFPDLTVEGVFKLFIFYLDDGYCYKQNTGIFKIDTEKTCYRQYTGIFKIDTEKTCYRQYTGIFKIDTEKTCYRQYTGVLKIDTEMK
jgi:hypothetical protein